jgi:hypothetical protein
LIVERERGPIYYGKWRDSTGSQVKKRLGAAWVVRSGNGWARRRGRLPQGFLDERAAVVALAGAIDAHEGALQKLRPGRQATFADAAALWLHHLEHVNGIKPSTLADYRYILVSPQTPARKRAALQPRGSCARSAVAR